MSRRLLVALALAGLLAPAAAPVPAAAAPGDHKTLVVRGRVTDPAGWPVAGVRVGASGTAGSSTRTGEDGRYTLAVPLGTALEVARHPFEMRVGVEARGWRFTDATGDARLVVAVEITVSKDGVGHAEVRSNSAAAARAVARALPLDGDGNALVEQNFVGVAGAPGHAADPALDQVERVELPGFPAGGGAATGRARPPEPAAPPPTSAAPEGAPRAGAAAPAAREVSSPPARPDSAAVVKRRARAEAGARRAAARAEKARADSVRRAEWIATRRMAREREEARRAAERIAAARADSARQAAWYEARAREDSARAARRARASARSGARAAAPPAARVSPASKPAPAPMAAPAPGDSSAGGSAARPRVGGPGGPRRVFPGQPPIDSLEADPRLTRPPILYPTPPATRPLPEDTATVCECRIYGTVEVSSDHPLAEPARVVVSLAGRPARRDTVDLFMGPPRAFDFPRVPCGVQRIELRPLGRARFAIRSADGTRPVACAGGSERHLRIVLEPR